jgi:hypothetical protein
MATSQITSSYEGSWFFFFDTFTVGETPTVSFFIYKQKGENLHYQREKGGKKKRRGRTTEESFYIKEEGSEKRRKRRQESNKSS